MLRYRVDLSSLDMDKRVEACNLLRDYSYFIERVISENGLEAVIVNWDSPEDFINSPVFPKGCPCTLITY